jgi:hypothetical protein
MHFSLGCFLYTTRPLCTTRYRMRYKSWPTLLASHLAVGDVRVDQTKLRPPKDYVGSWRRAAVHDSGNRGRHRATRYVIEVVRWPGGMRI